MDATAFALARENRMPIIVFSIREPGAIEAVLRGKGPSPLSSADLTGSRPRRVSRARIRSVLAATGCR